MSTSEIISLSIAIISLIISVYVVVRDQNQKRFDLLMTMFILQLFQYQPEQIYFR